jgi:hypothetical protein
VFQAYGIGVIERGDAELQHPGVIATFVGDEPHRPELDYYRHLYKTTEALTDKPVMTTSIGDGIGIGGRYWFWEAVQPKIRSFRWYGVKKHHYGIQHHVHYKQLLPFSDVLRVADTSFNTPYWIILPALGSDSHEAYFQFPSPAQHRGLLHLAAAHGATGMIFYTLQNADGLGLINKVTLAPIGENLAAIGDVARRIQRHAELLRRLDVGGLDIRCSNPDIEPVPLGHPDGGQYVYVVNRDTRKPQRAKFSWPRSFGAFEVHDLYADAPVPTTVDPPFICFELDLAAGGGTLLQLREVTP